MSPPAGLIGPNAIVRVAEVLPLHVGPARAAALFAAAGLRHCFDEPPRQMVAEDDVRRLHATLRAALGPTQAAAVAREAGRRTADYLLARRIPKPAQWLLERLPARAAARMLLGGIGRHAWTFAGSGHFSARLQADRVELQIDDNPMCRGERSETAACDFYAAAFERLFALLVHPDAQVQEVSCEGRGDDACRFEVRW